MDIYFIVAELEFTAGKLHGWLTGPEFPGGVAVSDLLDGAEGDVSADVDGDRFSLRAYLVDAAYFEVSEQLEASFALAAALGARGSWYSGDHVSGRYARLGKPPGSVKVEALPPDVKSFLAEAGEMGERARTARSATKKTKNRARPAASTARATKKPASPARPGTTTPTKRSAAAPTPKKPARVATSRAAAPKTAAKTPARTPKAAATRKTTPRPAR